jgi:transcriptional regulator with XRE-family HTH domain
VEYIPAMPSIRKPERQRTRTFIKAWREHRGLSQDQVAGRIEMSRENYGRIENGKVPYNQDVLEMTAIALNCSVSDLLERDPRIENSIDELRALMSRASENDQKRALALLKTFFQNNG